MADEEKESSPTTASLLFPDSEESPEKSEKGAPTWMATFADMKVSK